MSGVSFRPGGDPPIQGLRGRVPIRSRAGQAEPQERSRPPQALLSRSPVSLTPADKHLHPPTWIFLPPSSTWESVLVANCVSPAFPGKPSLPQASGNHPVQSGRVSTGRKGAGHPVLEPNAASIARSADGAGQRCAVQGRSRARGVLGSAVERGPWLQIAKRQLSNVPPQPGQPPAAARGRGRQTWPASR